MAEIYEKIPIATKWETFADVCVFGVVMRGEKIIAPVLGKQKWLEINHKAWGENGKRLFPKVEETLNISGEDAGGAAKLAMVAVALVGGPKLTAELVEESKERAVVRTTKCPWWEMYQALDIHPELIPCEVGHQAFCEEGIKAIDSKATFTLTKALPKGDSYCEGVYEFNEE
jgi:hypothetical protein